MNMIPNTVTENPVPANSTVSIPRNDYLELTALVDFYANECKHNGHKLNFIMVEHLRVRLAKHRTQL